jgi:uncharacterized membrane protein HdeD (DUF308 family)
MFLSTKIRAAVLTIHGFLALSLGLAFFYLRATMTNMFFEAFAVIGALMLSAAALILAAITDWFAAFTSGMKSIHRITFYLLAGIAFALAGIFVGSYPTVYLQWLVVFAALHALAFGISALVFALNARHDRFARRSMWLFGTISVLFSGTMAGWIKYLDDRTAITLLGLYLCFVGLKMLYLAWNSCHQTIEIPEIMINEWLAPDNLRSHR